MIGSCTLHVLDTILLRVQELEQWPKLCVLLVPGQRLYIQLKALLTEVDETLAHVFHGNDTVFSVQVLPCRKNASLAAI